MKELSATIVLLALLWACGDGPPSHDTSQPHIACQGDVVVRKISRWPGNGLQLLVSTKKNDISEIRISSPAGAWQTALSNAGDSARIGLTLIVLAPTSQKTARQKQIAQTEELLSDLDDAERIGLAIGDTLWSDLSTDRAHLAVRLGEMAKQVEAARPDPVAATEWQARLANVRGPSARDLIWIDDGSGTLPTSVDDAVWLRTLGPSAQVDQVAQEVVSDRSAVLFVGACPPAPNQDQALALTTKTGSCTISLPQGESGFAANASCDAKAAARDNFPFSDTIEITRNPDQVAAWENADTDKNQEEFSFTLQMGAVRSAARGHFRGQTSLGCLRKSLSIDLAGKAAPRLLPGFESDEFLLISLCKDDGYFRQAFAESIFATSQLFSLHRSFVKLIVDGTSHGVYWLVEKPREALVLGQLSTESVLRRRFDPDGIAPEVDYAADSDARNEALATYALLEDIAGDSPKEEVLAQLENLMDVDAYLRWMAFASLFSNGDYIDEIFFWGAKERGNVWFRLLAWDPDDLDTPCHHLGKWAIADTCEVTYCAEANIDDALLRSPQYYQRYRTTLADVLQTWTTEKLAEHMANVRSELFSVLADDATASAMVELLEQFPAATSFGAARTEIIKKMDTFLTNVELRRQLLLQNLASCR